MEEAELIGRCQTGDENAFRLLTEQYRRLLYSAAYAITGDHGLAEDALQDGLLAAWRGIPSFHIGNNFKVWFARIVVNRAKNHRRRKKLRAAPLEEAIAIADDRESVEGLALRNEEREAVRNALQLLTEEQQQAVILRYYSGLTIPEIARALRCREGTVKSRLHRALERLGVIFELWEQPTSSNPGV